MVSGSCACTSITKPKSVGRFPLTSRHESPPSSERNTSQCFCMNSTLGREECCAMRWTQWPTSALGSGIDRKSTRLNSSHGYISYAVFCLKKKKTHKQDIQHDY